MIKLVLALGLVVNEFPERSAVDIYIAQRICRFNPECADRLVITADDAVTEADDLVRLGFCIFLTAGVRKQQDAQRDKQGFFHGYHI